MKLNISQSLIKDVILMNSPDNKDIIKAVHCPKYIKYKYVDGLETKPTDAMLYGKFFEWHLLGATRDGIEPKIPRIGIRDQRPTKSASKETLINYIMDKSPEAIVQGTGKGGTVTNTDLYNFIQTLPIDLSEGTPSTQEVRLLELVGMAKNMLSYMGLDVKKGDKQLSIKTGDLCGSLDWVVDNFNGDPKSIIDVKFTQSKIDGYKSEWLNLEFNESAKIQAAHYVHLYKKKYGNYIPFYFIVFGEDGWIKVLRYKITKSGLQSHIVLIDSVREMVNIMSKEGFKPKPEFNRCLSCPFNEVCEDRSLLPEIENFLV